MPKSDDSDVIDSPDPDSDVRQAFAVLGAEVEAYTDSLVKREAVPDVLLHFTDQAGLIGILQNKTLWASLATALNDASETNVGPDLLDFGGRMALTRSRYLDSDLIQSVIKGEYRIEGDERPSDYRTYVASLCAEDVAAHWMQYGRSGTGVAVVFDAKKLATLAQFRLCKVIYDTEKQFECLREIIARVDGMLEKCLRKDKSPTRTEKLKIVAADLLNRYIRMIGPQMKYMEFSAEDEWRLYSNEAWVPPAKVNEPTRSTRFRSAAGRIVPHKEVEIPPDSIKGNQARV